MFYTSLIFVVICILLFLYWQMSIVDKHWRDLGIPYLRSWTMFGLSYGQFLNFVSPSGGKKLLYYDYGNERLVGFTVLNRPCLLIRDPELIKQTSVKAFDHFTDHTPIGIKEDTDPLLAKNLMSLQGKKWRDMRTTLSPAFTSNKLKIMFELISECGKNMTSHLLQLSRDDRDDSATSVEMKDLFTRYANDVIATTAFGVNVDSFNDIDNEFYRMGKSISKSFFTSLDWKRILMVHFFSFILKRTDSGVTPKETTNYFRNLIDNNIKTREREGIVRPDILHLLMQSRKGTLKNDSQQEPSTIDSIIGFDRKMNGDYKKELNLSDDDIVAQAIIFFVAGFETTSTFLSFVTYELAQHTDIQNKAQIEIDEVLRRHNGCITYDALNEMKYLEMIILETLRKWPPSTNTDRLCTKPFVLKTPECNIALDVDQTLLFPIYGIQNDPKFFPNPETFDPERFNEENKKYIRPYTYLPFGPGPRGCIGLRFSIMESKLAICHMLCAFDLSITCKTEIPLKLKDSPFRLIIRNGCWIGVKPRSIS